MGILILEQALNGLQFGLMLFLLAAGLTLVFGIMDMINLAHGSLYMVGAYLIATCAAASGSFWIGLAAGIAGSLHASFFYVIKPEQFGFLRSIDILVIVVLGGLGSMSGTIIAAILLALLSTVLQEVSDIRMILYSLMLVLIMIFRPGGLMGSKELSQTVLGRVFTRKGAQP